MKKLRTIFLILSLITANFAIAGSIITPFKLEFDTSKLVAKAPNLMWLEIDYQGNIGDDFFFEYRLDLTEPNPVIDWGSSIQPGTIVNFTQSQIEGAYGDGMALTSFYDASMKPADIQPPTQPLCDLTTLLQNEPAGNYKIVLDTIPMYTNVLPSQQLGEFVICQIVPA